MCLLPNFKNILGFYRLIPPEPELLLPPPPEPDEEPVLMGGAEKIRVGGALKLLVGLKPEELLLTGARKMLGEEKERVGAL